MGGLRWEITGWSLNWSGSRWRLLARWLWYIPSLFSYGIFYWLSSSWSLHLSCWINRNPPGLFWPTDYIGKWWLWDIIEDAAAAAGREKSNCSVWFFLSLVSWRYAPLFFRQSYGWLSSAVWWFSADLSCSTAEHKKRQSLKIKAFTLLILTFLVSWFLEY